MVQHLSDPMNWLRARILFLGWVFIYLFTYFNESHSALTHPALLCPVLPCLSPVTLPTSKGCSSQPHLASHIEQEKAGRKTQLMVQLWYPKRAWENEKCSLLTKWMDPRVAQLHGTQVDSEALQRQWPRVKDLAQQSPLKGNPQHGAYGYL